MTSKYILLIGVKHSVNGIFPWRTVTCQEATLCSHPTHRLQILTVKSNTVGFFFYFYVYFVYCNLVKNQIKTAGALFYFIFK